MRQRRHPPRRFEPPTSGRHCSAGVVADQHRPAFLIFIESVPPEPVPLGPCAETPMNVEFVRVAVLPPPPNERGVNLDMG